MFFFAFDSIPNFVKAVPLASEEHSLSTFTRNNKSFNFFSFFDFFEVLIFLVSSSCKWCNCEISAVFAAASCVLS